MTTDLGNSAVEVWLGHSCHNKITEMQVKYEVSDSGSGNFEVQVPECSNFDMRKSVLSCDTNTYGITARGLKLSSRLTVECSQAK